MQAPWKKLENETGFAFYFNESTQQKQWDHPQFFQVKNSVDDCNYVKYSKYRLALKFRVLQKALFMEEVALSTILGVFSKHRLGTNESTLCLESYDLEAVLFDIYFAAAKQNNRHFDADFAVELMQNFLYNIFDCERQGKIQVSSTKLALALLSDCDLPEIFNLIFTLCADHNNCVTRLRLQTLLTKLVEMFTFMHEDVGFGQHLVNSTIEDCFSSSPGLVGLSENNFISWLEDGPHLFSWIPILFRIKSCEGLLHNAKCMTCKATPLIGLMYRCTKCIKYTQCQKCFFTGRINHSHKLSHSMREYSTTEAPSKEFSFKLLKKLFGLMPCSIKLNQTDSVVNDKFSSSEKDCFYKSPNCDLSKTFDSTNANHLQVQLQMIIKQLESQNRELHKVLLSPYNEKEVKKQLEEHKLEVGEQIQKLKMLREHLNFGKTVQLKNQSTPLVSAFKNNRRDLETMLSPIAQISENEEISSRQALFICGNEVSEESRESSPYSINDISTWIKDRPTDGSTSSKETEVVSQSPVGELHNDLDDALAKLQQILANNFTLDESLGAVDNTNLKHAVSEVEGMLTSFIDNVESGRASTVQPLKLND